MEKVELLHLKVYPLTLSHIHLCNMGYQESGIMVPQGIN